MKSKKCITDLVLQEVAKIQDAEQVKRHSRSIHRAKFLSIKNEVRQLVIDHKLPVAMVWKILKEKKIIFCSYPAFNNYCKYYLQENYSVEQPTKIQHTHTEKENSQKIKAIEVKAPKTFTLDSDPNVDDLL